MPAKMEMVVQVNGKSNYGPHLYSFYVCEFNYGQSNPKFILPPGRHQILGKMEVLDKKGETVFFQ